MNSFKRTATVLLMTASLVTANFAAAATSKSPSRSSSSSSLSKRVATPARMLPPSQQRAVAPSRNFGFSSGPSSSPTKSAPSVANTNTERAAPAPTKRMFGGFGSGSSTASTKQSPDVGTTTAQRNVVAAPPMQQAKPSMGRFGSTSAAATAAPLPQSTSALSNSMNKAAAQTNAMKAYERNLAAKKAAVAVGAGAVTGAVVASSMQDSETVSSQPASSTVQSAPTPAQALPKQNPTVAQTQAPSAPTVQSPPPVVRQSSNDNSMLWYALGQASVKQPAPTANHSRDSDREYPQSAPAAVAPTAAPVVASAVTTQAVTTQAAPIKKSSSGGIGFFSVLILMLLVGGAVWYFLNRQKALKAAAPKRNYSI